MHRPRILVGAMSGTSVDGVDAVVAEITGQGADMAARILGQAYIAYPSELRETVFSMRKSGSCALADLAGCGQAITRTYVAAVRAALAAARVDAAQVLAIAAHGQTLFHDPPRTIQWIDPASLAAETGCPVVSDFRRADCAAGGQGAPLVPFADFVLFRHPTKSRVLLNIGGIANVTILKAGGGLDSVIAFDTGPGNCLSDAILRSRNAGEFDPGGQRALAGRADEGVVHRVLADAYFVRPPPKSTDTPAMLKLFDGMGMDLNDALATACLLTARAVARAVPGPVDELIVAGGGAENRAIMNYLAAELRPAPVVRIEALGIPAVAREALAFALLGAATLDNLPSNVPSCTGARRAVVLGSITPRP